MRGEAGLRADLASLAIPFARYEHAAVFTVAESRLAERDWPGESTKNLFLKDAARAAEMERLLGIAPGSVTPLAMINTAPGAVTVVLDETLAAAERINVHPLRNTGTLGLAGADVLRLLRHWGHTPVAAAIPAIDG